MKKLMFVLFLILISVTYSFTQNASAIKIDSIAIKNTALDYAEGYYSGDAARMERALHPDFSKIVVNKISQTGKYFLSYSTFSILVEISRAKSGYLDPEKRKLNVNILFANEKTACVKVESAMFNDLLQIINMEGKWKIINVLWENGPDSRYKTEFDNSKNEMEAKDITFTAIAFFEGVSKIDAAKIEESIHPEFSIAQVISIKGTGKPAVLRNRYSALVENIRSQKKPDDKSESLTGAEILENHNGLAFVKVFDAKMTCFLQMYKFDDKWKAVNGFSMRN
jgi:hypothetical protein